MNFTLPFSQTLLCAVIEELFVHCMLYVLVAYRQFDKGGNKCWPHSKCHCYVFPTIIARDLVHPTFTDFTVEWETLSQYLNALNSQIGKRPVA